MKKLTKFLFSLMLSGTLSAASMQGLPVFAEENNEIPQTVLSEENTEETEDTNENCELTEPSAQNQETPEESITPAESSEPEESSDPRNPETETGSENNITDDDPQLKPEENTEEKETDGEKDSRDSREDSEALFDSSEPSNQKIAVWYEDVSDTAESLSGDISFVIHDNDEGEFTFGVLGSFVSASEASFNGEGKLSVTTQNSLFASGDDPLLLSAPSSDSSSYLYVSEDSFAVSENSEDASAGFWYYQDHHLFYATASDTWYISGTEDGSVTITAAEPEACLVSLYSGEEAPSEPGQDTKAPEVVSHPEIHSYVIEGTWYEAPSYSAAFKRPDGVQAEVVSLQWNLNGQPYGEAQEQQFDEEGKAYSSVYVEALLNQPYGVYPVSCTATIKDEDGTGHSVTTYTSNFIVTRGILADSVLTFSDVHDSFDNIGQAILDTMKSNNGLIPSLVIATGDFDSSQLAGFNQENIEKAEKTLIHPVKMQMAGIDTVWVSGNQDNGYAAAYANQSAGLGVSSLYMNPEQGMSGTGIIFDSRSADYKANAGTSRSNNQGMIVIGINYEDLGSQGAYSPEGGSPTDESKLTYGEEGSEHTVYAYLKEALQNIAKNYHGEPVIISAHAGLHVLGKDPSSEAAGGGEWGGNGSYNLNLSNAVVHLINYYASQYEMDIMFLFGHDHTFAEGEFLKLPGDTIRSTVSFSEKNTEDIQLNFTYGQSGYITETLGGKNRYSLILTDDTTIHRQMKTVGDSETLIDGVSASIERHEHSEPEPKPEPKPDPDPKPEPIPGPIPGSDPSPKSSSDDGGTSSRYVPVTCQMAGYTIDYAWNEAARACQPGYIDDRGNFHAYGAGRGRYYIPDTAVR